MNKTETPILTIPREEAKIKYLDTFIVRKPSNQVIAYRKAYHALAKGMKLIDVQTAIENAGLNELNQPRIAICRADALRCFFRKSNPGGGRFSMDNNRWRKQNPFDIVVPEGTFPNWPGQQDRFDSVNIKEQFLETTAPQVPPDRLPNGNLSRYYLLWEVDKWRIVPPRDPILLRRLSSNLFAVMAEWDLTDLEYAISRGSFKFKY